jgi:hypothetical protein
MLFENIDKEKEKTKDSIKFEEKIGLNFFFFKSII